jgi:hypothetical protein
MAHIYQKKLRNNKSIMYTGYVNATRVRSGYDRRVVSKTKKFHVLPVLIIRVAYFQQITNTCYNERRDVLPYVIPE